MMIVMSELGAYLDSEKTKLKHGQTHISPYKDKKDGALNMPMDSTIRMNQSVATAAYP